MRMLIALCSVLVSFSVTSGAECPFCSAVKQTLRQEMESMDAVAIGELVVDPNRKGNEIDGNAPFKLLKVLRGKTVKEGDVVEVAYFGPAKSEKKFLMMGVDPDQLLWSSPVPITKRAEEYLLKVPGLPEDALERLKFYQSYLEDEDSLLARDAYDEFAIAPYDQVKALKPFMNRKQLITWVEDDRLTAERKRLYYTMLGVCGESSDADLLEKRLRSEKPEARTGLDALVACYLTLKGEAGLPLIEELFLKNTKSTYSDTYSAIMALRFHGTEGGILDRSKIVKSLHHILARAELADLVIPDLARWEDWSQIDRMVALFKEADETSSWVRVPVINYLRSCPLPAAVEKLNELEKIDPKAVQRAKTFFPLPQNQPAKSDTSSNVTKPSVLRNSAAVQPLEGTQIAFNGSVSELGIRFVTPDRMVSPPVALVPMNRWMLASVGSMAILTLAIAMWLLLSKSDASQMGLIVLKAQADGKLVEQVSLPEEV